MAAFSEILQHYLTAIQTISGAQSVSLFVPHPTGRYTRSILVHAGSEPPTPELATPQSATEFSTRFASQASGPPEANGVLGPLIPSDAPRCALLPLLDDTGDPTAWIGLRELPEAQPPADVLERWPTHWWTWLRGLGQAITRDSIGAMGVLNDPVTGLPGRAALFEGLKTALERPGPEGATSVIFCSPDNFSAVNELRGLQAGDAVIAEISERLHPLLRPGDLLVRYGGVVFGVVLPDTPRDQAHQIAQQIHTTLSNPTYLDGNVHLYFSGGVAVADPTAPRRSGDALTLIQHGNQALNAAKRAGGNQVARWQTLATGDGADADTGGDELTGIFTGTMGKDYRNMVLLWDAVGFIADTGDPKQFASKVVQALFNAFRPERIAFFIAEAPSEEAPTDLRSAPALRLLHSLTTLPSSTKEEETFKLNQAEQRLVEQACAQGSPLGSQIATVESAALPLPQSALALPLLARERCVGCFYLDRTHGSIQLDSSDVHFLTVFANQIAVAQDRAMLAEDERRTLERKQLKLLGEVHELRQALSHARLVHASTAMENVLAIARQVAPTDATVLLTGESGTGKGVLADTIHKLSSRKDKPFIMVDCSAISSTLIESELFGHERGSFTGADKKTSGRLAEAHGGTVFLDEIGELPLEIQGKLLTFVQEKSIVPVGSSRSRQVDVRIIAATNRDLAAEVDARRFRRDLYYRLNVVAIRLPPLRDRPEDIVLLARHFLERSNVQYQKSVHGFTPEAEAALRAHPWPGNIRELQNRIMRAVILCTGEVLGPVELGFSQVEESPLPAASVVTTAPASPPDATSAGTPEEPWEDLDLLLKRIIQRVDDHRGHQPPPFGKWLEDDLVEKAYEKVGGIHRRGAYLLGVPETTFRRKMKQIQARSHIGPTPRIPEWVEVTESLDRLTSLTNPRHEDWLLKAREVLLTHVLKRFGNRVPACAALMGVTEPTIQRWRERLNEASEETRKNEQDTEHLP